MVEMSNGISNAARSFLAGPHHPFIDGRFVEIGGNPFKVDDSATGDIVAEVLDGGAMAVDAGVKAARKALEGPWSKLRPVEPGENDPQPRPSCRRGC